MSRPFDRITTESIIYQAFLLCMRRPFSLDFQIDDQFLASTEQLLESLTFQDVSSAANSPVLGIPLPLYRLILDVIHLCNSPSYIDPEDCLRLKKEMKYWETVAIEVDDNTRGLESPTSTSPSSPPHQHEHPHPEALVLYALAGSLLLDWIMKIPEMRSQLDISSPLQGRLPSLGLTQSRPLKEASMDSPPPPLPLPERSRQLSRALALLHRPSTLDTWTRSFLGWWPLLIFGYLVTEDEDIDVIRSTLRRMRRRIGYGVVERVLRELEAVWQSRQPPDNDVCEAHRPSCGLRS